jgi:hypothetical protein
LGKGFGSCSRSLVSASAGQTVTLGPDGRIYVGTISNGPTPGAIYAINPLTGDYDILSADGNISLVEGIWFFQAYA